MKATEEIDLIDENAREILELVHRKKFKLC